MSDPIVYCEQVYKSYWQGKLEVPAIRAIDLEVKRGEFMALAGPSGSGKTTLLNLIGGLDDFDKGTLLVEGQDLAKMDAGKRTELRLRRIGFIFQSYNLIPVLSALENVEYAMLLQGVKTKEREARARAILDEVGLQGMHDRRPNDLSGGQQQRVAVARAIVSSPAIVLADEPTANLDSETGTHLLEMMLGLNKKRGVTFIFSTHDQRVMDYARRLVYLRDGRIESDTVKESGPRTP